MSTDKIYVLRPGSPLPAELGVRVGTRVTIDTKGNVKQDPYNKVLVTKDMVIAHFDRVYPVNSIITLKASVGKYESVKQVVLTRELTHKELKLKAKDFMLEAFDTHFWFTYEK